MTSRGKAGKASRDAVTVELSDVEGGEFLAAMTVQGSVRLMNAVDLRAHALEVMRCTASSEYQAAVLRQLTELASGDTSKGAAVVLMLRERLRPGDARVLRPLYLEPKVTMPGKAMLQITVAGFPVGQWNPDDARTHVLTCLDMADSMEFLEDYRRYLVEEVGMSDKVALRTALKVEGVWVVRHVVSGPQEE